MNAAETPTPAADLPVEARPLRRLGLLPRLLGRILFRQARVDEGAVQYLRELAQRSTLVYVMQFRSVVEFLLVAHVLRRERLPLPEFVSGLPTLLLRPFSEVVAILWRRMRAGESLRRAFNPIEESARCRRLVASGKPVLIFMRTRAAGMRSYRSDPEALDRVRTGGEYLRELIIEHWSGGGAVSLVPLAVVRGRGYRRKDSRLATLLYTVREAPNELRRLVSLMWNAREISIVVGKDVGLRPFIDRYREEGAERVGRRLSRAMRIFLHREERLVLGPTLLPKRAIRDRVLHSAEVEQAVAAVAEREQKSASAIRRRAESFFDEMAASYHGSYFGLLAFAFNRIWPRMFGGVEHVGLEKVIACARQHPIVLVPCHRSHFDYLILSYVFHREYLSPPHIAAGINLAFWPLGPLFRGAGAYFIRRTFGDNELYKAVFRSYLTFLIQEGYTQEFFIEGGRSRTGKMLRPKLGLLSALVNAYVEGARRDLYFVPVSIHYGRVVEEGAYERELHGEGKQKESLKGLIRARTVLRQYYGSVYVSFAEPISLRSALGERLESYRQGAAAEIEARKHQFVEELGDRLVRDIDAVAVVGATSVCSTVLLASACGALRYSELLARAVALGGYFDASGVLITASLRDSLKRTSFRSSCEFLSAGGLISRIAEPDEVLHVADDKRAILDFYKNNLIHFCVIPCLVVRALRVGSKREQLTAEIAFWLDVYRLEFPSLTAIDIAAHVERALGDLQRANAVGDGLTIEADHPLVRTMIAVLDNFDECYWLVAQELAQLPKDGLSERPWREAMAARYRTALLLGEVHKREGNSSITINNALQRFAALGAVTVESSGGKRGPERRLRRGQASAAVDLIERRLAAMVEKK